jgi:hypothetical protein
MVRGQIIEAFSRRPSSGNRERGATGAGHDLLEENAAEFVDSYVQRGGQ